MPVMLFDYLLLQRGEQWKHAAQATTTLPNGNPAFRRSCRTGWRDKSCSRRLLTSPDRQANDTRWAGRVLNVSSWSFQAIPVGLLQPEDAQRHLRPFSGSYLDGPPTVHPGAFAPCEARKRCLVTV